MYHAPDSDIQASSTRDADKQFSSSAKVDCNLVKSSLVPSQVMTHLGASIDTLVVVVRPTPDNFEDFPCCLALTGYW